jgi:hypothetical protein
MSLLTKENISIFISIISICIALYTFLDKLKSEKVKLSVEYIGHLEFKKITGFKYFLHLNIVNQSSLPVSISNMSLEYNGSIYNFWIPKEEVFHISSNKSNKTKSVYTLPLPYNLISLGATSGFFSVTIDNPDIFNDMNPEVNLLIQTNSKLLKFPIELSKQIELQEYLSHKL